MPLCDSIIYWHSEVYSMCVLSLLYWCQCVESLFELLQIVELDNHVCDEMFFVRMVIIVVDTIAAMVCVAILSKMFFSGSAVW